MGAAGHISKLSALASLALLASACGARVSVSTHGTATGPLAYAACMRSHGVARFPDPAGGVIPKTGLQQLRVSSTQLAAAQAACRRLLPNGGRPPSRSRIQEVKAQSLRFARCVRAHGVPGFPDPGSDGRIPDPATVGIDQGSPRFQAANTACASSRPPYMPSNASFDAWARTHPS